MRSSSSTNERVKTGIGDKRILDLFSKI